MAKFSKRSIDALKGVHPDLILVMTTAICDTPHDFTIVEGVRTQARQQSLYAQGRTTKGQIVTKRDGVVKKSNHQVKADGFGHAVDIYPFKNGKVDFNAEREAILISKHIKAVAARLGIAITWGGDWKDPYDPPHYELKQ